MDLEKLKYPIGKFNPPENIDEETINLWINIIEKFPHRLKTLVGNLTTEQLKTQYRPEGWTIAEVINHCADSHINGYVRFKWTLSEDTPVIKAYDQDGWNSLGDNKVSTIKLSLALLTLIHEKWMMLVRSLTSEDLDRKFNHPEHNKEFSLKTALGIYSWHCEHHYSHIANLIKEKGW